VVHFDAVFLLYALGACAAPAGHGGEAVVAALGCAAVAALAGGVELGVLVVGSAFVGRGHVCVGGLVALVGEGRAPEHGLGVFAGAGAAAAEVAAIAAAEAAVETE